MTAMPPEPGFSPQGDTGMPPQWPAFSPPRPYNPPPAYYPPPPQQAMPRQRPRVMSWRRIFCGIVWGVLAGILAAGAVAEWVTGIHGGAFLCLVIAVGAGWYDYRAALVHRLRARSR